MNLFNAYVGKHLTVSWDDDRDYAHWFPNVFLFSEYRIIDSWLDLHPKRRGTRRFVRMWLKEEQRKMILKGREARVGSFDPGPVRIKESYVRKLAEKEKR